MGRQLLGKKDWMKFLVGIQIRYQKEKEKGIETLLSTYMKKWCFLACKN